MIGTRFQDVMDETRIVKPLSQQGRSYTCAIYWWDGLDLRYGGKAPIPVSLFDEKSPWTARIGFLTFGK